MLSLLLFGAINTSHASTTDYRALAEYHSPYIEQRVETKSKADQITRIDFDGDWISNNNWQNTTRFPTPGYVYYEVLETETHWFLFYMFFHPRDYQWICWFGGCHENDIEGVRLTVEKREGSSFGKAILIDTIAHSEKPWSFTWKSVALPTGGDASHPVVWSEPGGHGVYPWDIKKFWSKKYHYYYGGFAQNPGKSSSGLVSYDLLEMWPLWERRWDVGPGKLWLNVYQYIGARFSLNDVPQNMAGEKYKAGAANPFFGAGDWFFDPAYEIWVRWGKPSGFSLTYLRHPYINP